MESVCVLSVIHCNYIPFLTRFTCSEHYLRRDGLFYLPQNWLSVTIRQNWMPPSDFICDIIYLDANLEKNCLHFSDTAHVFLKI